MRGMFVSYKGQVWGGGRGIRNICKGVEEEKEVHCVHCEIGTCFSLRAFITGVFRIVINAFHLLLLLY